MTLKERNHKKRVILSCLLVLFIVGAVAAGFYVKQTPRYSLYMLKKAALDHDGEKALQYLDINSIIDNMIKDVFTEEKNRKERPRNRFEGMMRNAGRDVILQNLPAIKEQLGEQLKSAIASSDNDALLDNLRKATVFGLKISMEGETALVSIRGKDKVSFKMKRAPEGHWKITAFDVSQLGIRGLGR